jgi:hypothetical protein
LPPLEAEFHRDAEAALARRRGVEAAGVIADDGRAALPMAPDRRARAYTTTMILTWYRIKYRIKYRI